jgi:hypothetical protein
MHATLLLLLTPLAHALLVLPPTTLRFPDIPLELGVRHIHTPEHFPIAHGLSLPGFAITSTHPPQRVSDYTIIAFCFQSVFGERSARMFTNDRCTSNILFQDSDDRAYLLTTLRVTPNGLFGHDININGNVFVERPLLEQIATSIVITHQSMHDTILHGYSVYEEDSNLLAYRRMVLFGE